MPRTKHPGHPSPEDYSKTTLRRANWETELELVRRLFQDYRAWLADHATPPLDPDTPVPAGLAQLDRVIEELPGAYGPPRGGVILAYRDDNLAACGALRGFEPGVAEIRRIYVRGDHRGPGFGPVLTGALLDLARELGYPRVRVYTMPTMYAAIQFYQDMGFKPIPAYWPHPVAGALFFEWNSGDAVTGSGPRQSTKSGRATK
jgi:carbonic anhydrase